MNWRKLTPLTPFLLLWFIMLAPRLTAGAGNSQFHPPVDVDTRLAATDLGAIDRAPDLTAARLDGTQWDGGLEPLPLRLFESPHDDGATAGEQSSTENLELAPLPPAAPLDAGDVLQSWPASAQAFPWGIGFHSDGTVWVGDGWGDDILYQYLSDGSPTGTSHPFTWNPANGPADSAVNWRTGMIWSLDVGGDNCIHEIDPVGGVTGNTICPSFSVSQRGLAYDPATDTWFAGGWNDSTVYHFDAAGNILDQVNVGLAISGLAYNPESGHLFAMVNASPNPTYVLDVADNYNAVGQFTITGFDNFSGAGLEIGCDGTLWAVQQSTDTVYQVDSGESTTVCGYGRLAGTVNGLGYCDANPAPIEDAEVMIEASDGMTWTLTTDPSGGYGIWLNDPENPLTVSVSAAEHEPGLESGVVVSGQMTTTLDFDLRWLQPCVGVRPDAFEVTLGFASSTVETLDVDNDGAASTTLELREISAGYVPSLLLAPETNFSAPAPVGPSSVRSLAGADPTAMTSPAAPLAWMMASPLPSGDGVVRYGRAQCADDADSFYVISGVDESFSVTDKVWRYDADSDTWNPLAPYPDPQEGPTAVCHGGFIYTLSGGGTNGFYVYDIADDSWSAGPPFPRNVWGAAAGAWGNSVYFIGGDSDFSFGGTSTQVDIFNIGSGMWSTGTSMPAAAVTPAYVQAGEYVYVVGGWGDASPGANVDQTQRYDMSTDTWETGPTFSTALSDGSLAITEQSLYVMGGDTNGGGAFDPSNTVETLDWTAWPAGSWTDIGDPLPTAVTAHKGGYCTNVVSGGEVWSIGGYDGAVIRREANYRPSEPCFGAEEIPWLSEDPMTGTVVADSSAPIELTFDAGEVAAPGTYSGTLWIVTEDPLSGTLPVPVVMHVLSYGVEVHPPEEAMTGDPGTTVAYTLWVTNTGLLPDTYDLTLSGPGWPTSLSDSSVTLNAGEGTTIDVMVNVPAGASGGDSDIVTVTATSQTEPVATDASVLTTTSASVYGVAVAPPTDSRSADPGEVVTYTLWVTNTGNVADTYDLTLSGNAWPASLSTSSLTLSADEGAAVTVNVTIPQGSGGEEDVVTLTATSQNDATATDSADLTTVAELTIIYLPVVHKE